MRTLRSIGSFRFSAGTMRKRSVFAVAFLFEQKKDLRGGADRSVSCQASCTFYKHFPLKQGFEKEKL